MSIAKKLIKKKVIIKINLIITFIKRFFNSLFSKRKIYFTNNAYLLHPIFSEIKKHPPLNYSNKFNAEIFHFIQGCRVNDLKKNVIIEVIDHPLSILAPYFNKDLSCFDYIQNIDFATNLYLNDSIKKILLVSQGQYNIFKKYFPKVEILEKTLILSLPWKDNISKGKKIINENRTFLFIASDFHSKGVFLILDAWNLFIKKNTSDRLILVCHNIPIDIKNYLDPSIQLIEEIPLSLEQKDYLYSNADVVIAPSLTDGISPIEATSYGKPIIIFRGQHSNDFVDNENGILVDVPINIYDDGYGVLWKTESEYIDIILHMYKKNEFSNTIQSLTDSFTYFLNHENLILARDGAIEKFYNSYQIKIRNQKLSILYNEIYNN